MIIVKNIDELDIILSLQNLSKKYEGKLISKAYLYEIENIITNNEHKAIYCKHISEDIVLRKVNKLTYIIEIKEHRFKFLLKSKLNILNKFLE